MKVLFLNPPFKTNYGRYSRDSRSPAVTKSGTIYYPIWLAYAAGTLERAGFEVGFIDSCAHQYDYDKTYDIAKSFGPQMIVVNTSTPSIYNDVEVASNLKELIPKAFIVLTGTHVSALAEETLLLGNNKVDAVARHEYDYTLRELAEILSANGFSNKNSEQTLGDIAGISFLSGDKVIHTRDREFIENLDGLPSLQVYIKNILT